ncbi:hypothetical protein [Pacificibacter marinus]|uniref:hypothetical protein n=1 Tax=Pacificibacter marinus TaxID=658057 RepID=UPI00111399E0|nr:hypothetical protein [Pacificibacter marinus]
MLTKAFLAALFVGSGARSGGSFLVPFGGVLGLAPRCASWVVAVGAVLVACGLLMPLVFIFVCFGLSFCVDQLGPFVVFSFGLVVLGVGDLACLLVFLPAVLGGGVAVFVLARFFLSELGYESRDDLAGDEAPQGRLSRLAAAGLLGRFRRGAV